MIGDYGRSVNLYSVIVHFKSLGSRHIHEEIKLQKDVNGVVIILCKMNLIVIWRHI